MKYLKSLQDFKFIGEKFEFEDPSSLKMKIGMLIETNPEVVRGMIESGKLDPRMEHDMILRKAIKLGKNDLVKYILSKNIEFRNIGPVIGSCYEHGNSEAGSILIDHFNPTKEDLEKAIHWIKHSFKYKNENDRNVDIAEIEMHLKDLK
jgi:hypothetical protein